MIHHSHVDVGYTHTTAEISARYQQFFENILSEMDISSTPPKTPLGFKYTAECSWILDEFYKKASEDEKSKMNHAIKVGVIEPTGSYLNFTDSIYPAVYGELVKKAQKTARKAGTVIRSAMFSDVNGLNIGYALELAKNGVEYLFTNVHSGHGMYALNEKLIPFRWKLPQNHELLVYNGELYTYGNEFGFCPRGAFSDVIDDEGYQAKAYNYDAKMEEWIELAEKRFSELLGHLEEAGHAFDFIAMGIHGTDDDNAIPNPGIIKRIEEWNSKNGSQIDVKLVTLAEFFDEIKTHPCIKTYEGDWADWWSDGIGSAPQHFKYFKHLQQEYLFLKNKVKGVSKEQFEEIESDIALFAEHTFGHFLSVTDPFLYDSGSIQLVKESYIGKLIKNIDGLRQTFIRQNGSKMHLIKVSNRFMLINTGVEPLKTVVALRFDKFDLYTYPTPYKIFDNKGKIYKYFLKEIDELRAAVPHIFIELAPEEHLEITVQKWHSREFEISLFEKAFHSTAGVGLERLSDIHPRSIPKSKFLYEHVLMAENRAELSNKIIKWNKRGVFSIYDKLTSKELLNGKDHLGCPVFEVKKDGFGPVRADREANRRYRLIGRNIKSISTERFVGEIDAVDLLEDNPFYFELAFYYKLANFDYYRLILRIYKEQNKIEMNVCLTKNYVSKGHNLYIALPLTEQEDKVFLDRGNIWIEAWQEQLTGTLTQYNTVYGGFYIEGNNFNISVATPDVYLLQLKSYLYEPAMLMYDEIKEQQEFALYSWPITTMWHCNFFARESNHLSLNYIIEWGTELTRKSAEEKFKQASLGVIQFKI